ncbi:hypothetical protein MASR2M66_05210 [Chloroflexota bacterium]
MLKKLLLLVALAVLLAACLPAQQQPTADVQAQVNTAVAGTMQVNEQIDLVVELTVAAQDAAKSEASQAAPDSNVALQATSTAQPTITPMPIFTSIPTKALPSYSCSIVTKKPKTNEVFHGGDDFDIKWTITNTGTAAWYDAVDIKYYNGNSFANSKRAEIRTPLKPGESFDIVLDATAPKTPGYHFMAWMVDGSMCFGYVNIWVK